MDKTRFALTSAILMLVFGLMAPDCDCGSSGGGGGGSAVELSADPERGSALGPLNG